MRILLSGLAALALIAASGAQAQRPIQIVYDTTGNGTWYFDEGAPRPGPVVDLLQATADLVGPPIVFIRRPWSRALSLVEIGQADAVFDASYKAERAAYAVYPTDAAGALDASRRLYARTYAFFARRGDDLEWTGETLGPAPVAVAYQQGFAIADRIEALATRTETVANQRGLIGLLRAGRVDAAANLRDATWALARRMGVVDELVELEPPIETRDYYLIFSKATYAAREAEVEAFWDGLRAVRESPRWREILAAYQ